MAWALLALLLVAGCSKEGEVPDDPSGTATINMLNELNGETYLGTTDVYINKSNNFSTKGCVIVDMGQTGGLGAEVDFHTDNLVREAAVLPEHLFHIMDFNALYRFPSGAMAAEVGAGYYKAYVVSPIMDNNVATGALLKFVLAYPDKQDLPEHGQVAGYLDYYNEHITIDIPEGAEYDFLTHGGSGESDAFSVFTERGKLVVRLEKNPDRTYGPYGDYQIRVRQGAVYSTVWIKVGMSH